MIHEETFVEDMAAAMPEQYVDYWMNRLAVITPRCLMPSARRRARADIVRAQQMGITDPEQLAVLICTIAFRRHVWLPEQAAQLVAPGLLVDGGPVEWFPDRHWYVPAG